MGDDSPWDADGFRLKRLGKPFAGKQTHINRKTGKRIEWEFIKAD